MQTTSPFPVYALRLMSSYLQYKNCAAITQKCKACGSELNQIVNKLLTVYSGEGIKLNLLSSHRKGRRPVNYRQWLVGVVDSIKS